MTIGQIYEVIGIEGDDFRIINDENLPYLYDPEQFEIVDLNAPLFWVTEYGEDGERYSYPKEWMDPGFFEDYHDGIEGVKKLFWSVHCELYV